MIKRLDLTPRICAAIEAVRVAQVTYLPGGESSAVIELPKLALADAVLDALGQQRMERLPRRADRVAYVRVEAARRRRRG